MSAGELFLHPYRRHLEEVKVEIPDLGTVTPDLLLKKMNELPAPDPSHYEIFNRQVDRFNDVLRMKETSIRLENGSSFNGNFVTLITGQTFIVTQAPRISKDSPPFSIEKAFWSVFKENHVKAIVNLTHAEDRISCVRYTGIDSDPHHLKDEVTKTIYQDLYIRLDEEVPDGYHSAVHEFSHIVHEEAWQSQPPTPEYFSDSSSYFSDSSSENTPPRCNYQDFDNDPRDYLYVKVEAWKDRQGISLPMFSALVNKVNKITKDGLIMVHCSAGIGRAGTLIVACAINELVKQKLLTEENRNETIAALVKGLREQRNSRAVQTEAQMALLFDYADSELSGSKEAIKSTILQKNEFSSTLEETPPM